MSKFKYNYKNMIKEAQKGERSPLIVYGIIRLLIIICMILQLIRGDLHNAFLCFWALVSLFIPIFVQDKFKIKLPSTLEIIIFVFIFASEILGEINNFYGI
ncbi:MAG: hypothetical protein MR346_06575, partial [Clostridium sp.]|nr:hypothetical protein [Clostridium sp.]